MTSPQSPPPSAGPASPSNAAVVIEQLRARYQASAGTLLETLRGLAEAVGAAPTSLPVLEALGHLAHRVHGTAGSYGLTQASELAAAFEARVAGWTQDPGLDTGERGALAMEFARTLEVALRVG